MAQIVAPFFAPDIDNAWSVAPGALASMNAFAPLQNGTYGSIGTASSFNLTGSDILHGQTFKQVNGSVRLLMFRPGNIDEYDNAGTRTNRGTGYNASTVAWSSAAWGNQIIACNYLDATQSSTGAGFSGLGGSSPKARFVAANIDFVMLADVDDGGSNVYSDMVWWSGLRDPSTWTPAIATQAGNQRLLDAPGPIKGVVAFRDSFVVFKDNAIFVGEYVGPPPQGYIFSWRLVSARVGCIAPQSIAEVDGKLYWLHSSGFYEFDGQNLRQIGLPVFQSFQRDGGYIKRVTGLSVTVGAEGLSLTQAAADDIEGIVWFRTSNSIVSNSHQTMVLYAYNVRSGKWGRHQIGNTGTGATAYPRLVFTNYADQQAFLANKDARLWVVFNDSTSTFRAVKYPFATSDNIASSYTTGVFGSLDSSDDINKHYIRTLEGTVSDTGLVAVVSGYTSENKLVTNGTTNAVYNAEFDDMDFKINARFKTIAPTWTVGTLVILGGLGFNGKSGGKR